MRISDWSSDVCSSDLSKVNAFLNYQSTSGKWRASLWARNLTNKLTPASSGASGSLFGSPVLAILDPPRTFGLDLGLSFCLERTAMLGNLPRQESNCLGYTSLRHFLVVTASFAAVTPLAQATER